MAFIINYTPQNELSSFQLQDFGLGQAFLNPGLNQGRLNLEIMCLLLP